MPEGDTVYRTARRLTEALGGVPLRVGELRHPRLSTVDLAGRVLSLARPVGKHLFLRFDRSLSLHCHLGMDGSWRFYARPPPRSHFTGAPAGHRTRVVLATADRAALGENLHDLALLPTADEGRLVAHLGPDLLDPDWSADHAEEAVRRLVADPGREIGLALLDQKVVAGIGNVYKTELCFLLGVSPWTPVSDVDAAAAVALSRKLLLRNAMRAGRNTTGDPRRGRELWVYGRGRTGCLRCGGRVVVAAQGSGTRERACERTNVTAATPSLRGVAGDRLAYYCPRCQPGPTS